MTDAVLPSLGLGRYCFVSVRHEPFVDVAQNHSVSFSLAKCLVDELRIRLVLVDCRLVATGRRRPRHIRVGAIITTMIALLEVYPIVVLVLVLHLHEVIVHSGFRKGVVVLLGLNLIHSWRVRIRHADIVGRTRQIQAVVRTRATRAGKLRTIHDIVVGVI
jgi:hypothetical protein